MYMVNPNSQKALLLTKENFQEFEKFLQTAIVMWRRQGLSFGLFWCRAMLWLVRKQTAH